MNRKINLLFCLIFLAGCLCIAKAEINLDSSYNAMLKLKDDSSKIRMLRELGWKIEVEDSLKGRTIYLQTIALAQKIKDPIQESRSLTSLGIWYKDRSHYAVADSIMRKAAWIASKANSKADVAKAMGVVGNIFYSKDY